MKIKVTGASLNGGTGETEFTDISDFVSDVRVKGAAKECTRSLDFKLLRGDFDETLPDIDIKLGDAITMQEIDEETGAVIEEFYKGVVWTIKKADNGVAIDVTCYDKAIYLNKNEPDTQVHEKKTPDAVASTVITELGLNPGKLAGGSADDFNLRNKNGYDAIMEAYQKESEKTGKKFKIVFEDDKVNVYEVSETVGVVLEELDEPVVGKLLNTSYSESLDDVINEVKVIEDQKKDNKTDGASNGRSQALHGTIQKLVKGDSAEVAGLLADAKKEIDVECIGSWDMVTGKSIQLNSSIISGKFFITSDEHILDDAVHTVNLSLSSVYEM
mgnify:FL=1